MTRKSFLCGCAAGLASLATGCTAEDGDDTSAAGSSSSSTAGGSSGRPQNEDGPSPTQPGSGGEASTTGTGPADDSGADGSATDASVGGSTGGGGTSGGSESGTASACGDAVVAEIGDNHGHSLEIPLADVEAGVEATYSTTGSGHCHEVTLTAEDFAALRAGNPVIKFSCNGGDHQFVFSCAPGAPAPGDPGCEQNSEIGGRNCG